MDEVQKVTDYNDVKTMDKDAAQKSGMYVVIGREVDDAYMEELKSRGASYGCDPRDCKGSEDLYSPLHGTGNIPGTPCPSGALVSSMCTS